MEQEQERARQFQGPCAGAGAGAGAWCTVKGQSQEHGKADQSPPPCPDEAEPDLLRSIGRLVPRKPWRRLGDFTARVGRPMLGRGACGWIQVTSARIFITFSLQTFPCFMQLLQIYL